MEELRPFVDTPGGTVIEVGSRDGHDANRMKDIFSADRVITVEANPDCHANIERDYPAFENFNLAISNVSGQIDFYRVRSHFPEGNVGQSSTMYRNIYDSMADKISVPALTMDEFLMREGVDEIAAIKIDVEGATFQVLEGFSSIRKARLLHIESEHYPYWPGQKLYEDTKRFMVRAGFEQVYFKPVFEKQSDSIWRRVD